MILKSTKAQIRQLKISTYYKGQSSYEIKENIKNYNNNDYDEK